jgi:hypothetical protein
LRERKHILRETGALVQDIVNLLDFAGGLDFFADQEEQTQTLL